MSLRSKYYAEHTDDLLFGSRFTKTTVFLLPLIDLCFKDFSFNGDNKLINCHLNYNMSEIFVILLNDDTEGLNELMFRMGEHHLFSESFDDGEHIILAFDMKSYKKDIEAFGKGQYSKLSDRLKEKLTDIYGKINIALGHKVSIYDAIYPSETKRKSISEFICEPLKDIPEEVMSKPNIKLEQFISNQDLELYYGVK